MQIPLYQDTDKDVVEVLCQHARHKVALTRRGALWCRTCNRAILRADTQAVHTAAVPSIPDPFGTYATRVRDHRKHAIEIASYGDVAEPWSRAVECADCYTTIYEVETLIDSNYTPARAAPRTEASYIGATEPDVAFTPVELETETVEDAPAAPQCGALDWRKA